jgi:ABC-2 type transport system ATP-binding protein
MEQGTTILLTTQYLEEADQLADKIVLINNGTVAAEGTAQELKSKIGSDQLVLSFEKEQHTKKAASLLASLHGHLDESSQSLVLPINNDGSDVKQILETCAAAKLPIAHMDIRKPTLDDVFLSLTEKEKA